MLIAVLRIPTVAHAKKLMTDDITLKNRNKIYVDNSISTSALQLSLLSRWSKSKREILRQICFQSWMIQYNNFQFLSNFSIHAEFVPIH
jgi:hypothetical protein